MSKVIRCSLSVSSINDAIKEIDQYKADIESKTTELRTRIANQVAQDAQARFSVATLGEGMVQVGDTLMDVSFTPKSTSVSVTDSGNITIVTANGQDVIWIEFGTGVTNNGSAGSSPHPQGSRLGFTIGSYGQGKGKQKQWGYYESEVLYITSGVKAQMPMAKAMASAINDLIGIAKEVFGT